MEASPAGEAPAAGEALAEEALPDGMVPTGEAPAAGVMAVAEVNCVALGSPSGAWPGAC